MSVASTLVATVVQEPGTLTDHAASSQRREASPMSHASRDSQVTLTTRSGTGCVHLRVPKVGTQVAHTVDSTSHAAAL